MKIIFICLMAIFLSGCADGPTVANYERVLRGWVGKNEDALVMAWGPPKSKYVMKNGDDVLTYSNHSAISTSTYYDPYFRELDTYASQSNCTTNFFTDSSGIIKSWRWDGNDCVAYAANPDHLDRDVEDCLKDCSQHGLKDDVCKFKCSW